MKYFKPGLIDFGSGASPDCSSGSGASWSEACTTGPTNTPGSGSCSTGDYVATNYGCTHGAADILQCLNGSENMTWCSDGGIATNTTGCQTGTGPAGI